MNSLAPQFADIDSGWSVPPPAVVEDMLRHSAGLRVNERTTDRYPTAMDLSILTDTIATSHSVSDEYDTLFVVSPLETEEPEERELVINEGQELSYLGIRQLGVDVCHVWWSPTDSAFVGALVI